MQQIVGQLLFDGDPDVSVAEMSPWLDLRVPPKEVKLPVVEAQTHRRFLETHLPVDALRFSPTAKYVYIGRDGRDVVWSMYNHHANANQSWVDAVGRIAINAGTSAGPGVFLAAKPPAIPALPPVALVALAALVAGWARRRTKPGAAYDLPISRS